jgi:hypothetical protein
MTFHKYDSDINKFLTYTRSGLLDSIFLELCKIQIPTDQLGREINVKITIPDKEGDKPLLVSKYFERSIKLAPSIILGKPTPKFIIDKSDISSSHITALLSYHPYHQKTLVKQIGLRIFEVVCPRIVYGSIAPKLKVKIPGVIET